MVRKTVCRGAISFFLVLSFLSTVEGAPLQEKDQIKLCKKFYREKKFLRAALCFGDLVKILEQKSKGDKALRSRLGIYFRNIAISYRKHAESLKEREKRAYFFEKGLEYILQAISKKYYENSEQKRILLLLKDKLVEKVGYQSLTVDTGDERAEVFVSGGYKFRGQKKRGKTVVFSLRPGKYSLRVSYPNGGVQYRNFSIEDKPVFLNFSSKVSGGRAGNGQTDDSSSPVEAKVEVGAGPPSWPKWVMWGVAGFLVPGVIAHFLLADSISKKVKSDVERVSATKGRAPGVGKEFARANFFQVSAYVFIGVAVLSAGGGLVYHFLARPQSGGGELKPPAQKGNEKGAIPEGTFSLFYKN